MLNLKIAAVLAALILCPILANAQTADDSIAIRQVVQNFTESWLRGDEPGVLSLCEESTRVSPGSQCPIDSLHNLRKFWFPKDGSTTVIHRFDFEILSMHFDGDRAFTTQKMRLVWSYSKGETRLHKDQLCTGAMVFRKQPEGAWKIWREQLTVVRSIDL